MMPAKEKTENLLLIMDFGHVHGDLRQNRIRYPVPSLSMMRSGNFAWPFTNSICVDPPSFARARKDIKY